MRIIEDDICMERSIDVILNIEGIYLKDGENLEDIIKKIESIVDTIYPIKYEIVQEEYYDEL